MTFASDNEMLDSYIPVYDAIPETWNDARPFLIEQLKQISNAINIREIGWFLDEELLSGKAFIPTSNTLSDGGTSQQFRQVLRKVIDFGTLPNAGTKSIPHGINVTSNFTLVTLYGAATDPVALIGFQFPYADPIAIINAVALTIDATNVNITTGINRSNFTRAFIVIEYLQEL